MKPAARVWLTVGPLALAAGGGALALVLTSGHEENEILTSILGLLVGWSFVVAGLIARTRRPENRTGILMLVVGFTFFIGALADSNQSLVFSVGWAFGAVFIAALVHLLLAYPSGELDLPLRAPQSSSPAYAVAFLANALPLLFDRDPAGDCDGVPGERVPGHAQPADGRGALRAARRARLSPARVRRRPARPSLAPLDPRCPTAARPGVDRGRGDDRLLRAHDRRLPAVRRRRPT